jgi:NAD-dependent deacetylase
MLIVAGTSLTVYPASGMVNLFNGKNLVVINRDKTGLDNRADLVINRNIKEVFWEWDGVFFHLFSHFLLCM